MDLKVLLFLWFCSGPVQSSVIWRHFWYLSGPKTWKQAQQKCRRDGGDLATVVTEADLWDLDMNQYHAWIGLKETNYSWFRQTREAQDVENNQYNWTSAESGSGNSSWNNNTSGESDDDNDWYNQTWDEFTSDFSIWVIRRWFGWWYFRTSHFAADEPDDGEKCGKLRYLKNQAFGDFCHKKLFVFCEEYYKHHFIPKTMTWAEGEQECEQRGLWYMDFRPGHTKHLRDFPVWIGLQRHGDGWSWSDGTQSDFRNWTSGSASGSDLSPTPGDCVAVSSQHRSMFNVSCSEEFPSVCYRHNVFLQQKNLSWEEALKSCENMSNSYNHSSFRLLSLEEDELDHVLSHAHSATTTKVWVGLRFLAGSWFWSDGVPVSLSLEPCPEVHCGALDLSTSSIEPTDCRQKLNLLCYGSGPQWS